MNKSDSKSYTKSVQDELDWKLLDQLHSVVAQISNFCFDIKKFCITTLFVVMAFLVKFTSDKLDHSIFVAALLITICFWFLDSTAYFYQVKLRGTMRSICERLASNAAQLPAPEDATVVIAPARVSAHIVKRAFSAGINPSMLLYVILLVTNFGIWLLFAMDHIK